MNILVLGATGMLGHRLWLDLSPHAQVWATIRGRASFYPLAHTAPDRVIEGVDALDWNSIHYAFARAKPDVVINCIGVIKQRHEAKMALPSVQLNALFPHQLAALCAAADARLIHISTDCVFTGLKGDYIESDPTDAHDIYGKTKALGEIDEMPGVLTIRTSIIGRELATHYGLLEWFLSQTGSVRGFQRAIFSGFPTGEIARIIARYILPDTRLEGLYHVSAQPINKYDLLCLFRDAFGHDIEIVPDSAVSIDRSLNSDRFRARTGFQPASWVDMIERMASERV
jgi:dTDP-4-dehydrorhamnose reductase